MKKQLLMLVLGVFFVSLQAFAQQKTVTGKVTDDEGLPLPGASISIKGSTTGGTSTRTDGTYSIVANASQVLQFKFIGTKTVERTVGTNNVINVQLTADAQSLNEVVVTAQGIERSKRSLGYEAQTTSGADIAGSQRENFINALQGRVAGVTITPTNGTPGA